MGRADVYPQPRAPDPVLTDELVLDLTRRHTSNVHSVTGMDESGGEARVYLVDEAIVVKTQRPHRLRPRTSLAKEAHLLDALAAALGGWIPRLLGYDRVDTDQGPVEYVCMTQSRASPPAMQLAAALGDVQGMIATFVGWLAESQGGEDPKVLYKTGLHSRRLLLALGDLIVGWLLLRRADVALRKLAEPTSEEAFYNGVVASARFFAREVLPRLASDRRIVELATLDTMDLAEESF